MIAHLGMYDPPALHAANDRFWQAIAARLGYGPARRSDAKDVWAVWTAPDLLLAQTCGYPYRAKLHGAVTLIGTPDYGVPDCPPGYYRSVLVVRADDPATRLEDLPAPRFAYNEALSQSGWAAPMTHLAGRLLPRAVLETGSHAASAAAVADGRAELAGLDALTWTLLQRHTAVARRLRVLDHTAPTPGLPYITARTRDPAPIARAVAQAIQDLPAADRAALHLKGLVQIPARDYLNIPTPPGPADLGFA